MVCKQSYGFTVFLIPHSPWVFRARHRPSSSDPVREDKENIPVVRIRRRPVCAGVSNWLTGPSTRPPRLRDERHPATAAKLRSSLDQHHLDFPRSESFQTRNMDLWDERDIPRMEISAYIYETDGHGMGWVRLAFWRDFLVGRPPSPP